MKYGRLSVIVLGVVCGFLLLAVAVQSMRNRSLRDDVKLRDSAINGLRISVREFEEADTRRESALDQLKQAQWESEGEEANRKAAEPEGHEPKTPEERDEQKRLAAGLQRIFDDATKRNPGHREYVTDAVKMPGEGNWLFKTHVTYEGFVTPDGVELSGGESESVYAFDGGQLDDRRRDESEFIWASQGARVAADYYAVKNVPDTAFDVESLVVDRFGSLRVFVRIKGTGELKRITVEDFIHESVEHIDE